jgi:hypothetical protein
LSVNKFSAAGAFSSSFFKQLGAVMHINAQSLLSPQFEVECIASSTSACCASGSAAASVRPEATGPNESTPVAVTCTEWAALGTSSPSSAASARTCSSLSTTRPSLFRAMPAATAQR